MPTEYPKPDRPVSEKDAANRLDTIAAVAATVGIDLPAIDAGRDLVARSRRFIEQGRQATEDKHDAAKRIARELVTGRLDFDRAVTEAARVEAMQQGGVLTKAVHRTEVVAAHHAFDHIGRDLDGDIVLKRAREIAGDTLDQIRKLRPKLDGIRNADQATEAGATTAKAWATYRSELLPRWEAAHELAKLLRLQHWIAPLPLGTAAGRYGRYDLARMDNQAAKRKGAEPLLLLLDEVCDRWLPGGPYTEAEAAEFERLIDQDREHNPDPDEVEMERRTGRGVFA